VKISSSGKKATARADAGALTPVCAPQCASLCAPLFAALLASCGAPTPHAAATPPGVSTASPGPVVDFAFDSLDDRPVSSESTRGKVTVLLFLTTGSILSQAEADFLVAMAKNDGDRLNYAAVALETRENRELVELYRKALSIPFPIAMADAQTLAGTGPFHDVSAVPVTVVIDRSGRVVWRMDGRVAKSDELRSAMRGL
jgi:thiol-disulfide isomerase/thioredoxin